MKMQQTIRKCSGITLVEGLVALLVLSLGLLALFNFQAGLLTSGADSKTRSEAIQLAQDKLGDLRTQSALTYSTVDAFLADSASLFSGTEGNVQGTAAQYKLVWSASNHIGVGDFPVRKTVSVMVAWANKDDPDGTTEGTPDGINEIHMSSDIRWKNPKLTAGLLTEALPGGNTIPNPQGGAQYVNETSDSDTSGTPNSKFDDGTSSKYKEYYNASKKRWELIDQTGTIRLVSQDEFSTVSGRIYADAGNNATNSLSEAQQLLAGAPDISVCDTGGASNTTGTITDGSTIYYYRNYKCFMGAGWFGSIGMYYTIESVPDQNFWNQNDGCVGDPTETIADPFPDPLPTAARYPVVSKTREFRGYKLKLNSSGEPDLNDAGYRQYLTEGLSAGKVYKFNDFLVIGGNNNDSSDCKTKMELTDPSQFEAHADTPEDYPGNTGWFVCLSSSCPEVISDDVPVPYVDSDHIYTISGSRVGEGTFSSVTTSDGDVCTLSNGGVDYSCTVYDLGSGWSGYITATPANGYTIFSDNPLVMSGISADVSGANFTMAIESLSLSGEISGGGAIVSVTGSNGGVCTVAETGLSYSCTVPNSLGGWSGVLTVTAAENAYIQEGATVSQSASRSISITEDRTGEDFTVELLPTYTISVRSQSNGGGSGHLTSVTADGDAGAGSADGSCVEVALGDYDCTVTAGINAAYNEVSWTGTLQLSGVNNQGTAVSGSYTYTRLTSNASLTVFFN